MASAEEAFHKEQRMRAAQNEASGVVDSYLRHAQRNQALMLAEEEARLQQLLSEVSGESADRACRYDSGSTGMQTGTPLVCVKKCIIHSR